MVLIYVFAYQMHLHLFDIGRNFYYELFIRLQTYFSNHPFYFALKSLFLQMNDVNLQLHIPIIVNGHLGQLIIGTLFIQKSINNLLSESRKFLFGEKCRHCLGEKCRHCLTTLYFNKYLKCNVKVNSKMK